MSWKIPCKEAIAACQRGLFWVILLLVPLCWILVKLRAYIGVTLQLVKVSLQGTFKPEISLLDRRSLWREKLALHQPRHANLKLEPQSKGSLRPRHLGAKPLSCGESAAIALLWILILPTNNL